MVWPRPWVALGCLLLRGGGAIDGQSYKASEEETERVWNDPNCERTRGSQQGIDWDEVRSQLLTVPFPQSAPTVTAAVQRLQRTSELDDEAARCPFGVIAVLFFWIKYLIEEQTGQLPLALVYHSLLDALASGMHPHLLDRSDWLVKDQRLIALRRALLGRTRARAAPRPRSPLVFVYDKETPELRELTQGASFCGKGQWGMEVHIHEWLLASGHLTKNAEEADFFFVPAYGICMFEAGFLPYPVLDERYTALVRGLPHFRGGRGRDHIFTFGSGMSANVFRSWRQEIPGSIFLTPETHLFNDFPDIVEPCFDTWKDISIPGYLHRHEVLSLTSQAVPLQQREHLAVFLGRTDSSRGAHPSAGGVDVRGAIRELHVQGKIYVGQNLSIPDMHAVMGNAKFCFVPKGKSAWSLRFYEALFANCVPVVLSDHWELPFQDFLDLPSFVIKWPMTNVGDGLLDYLRALPDGVVEAYMERSRQFRCWFVFPPLLHEVDVPRESDELYKVCPQLAEENAFEGIVHLLERKRLAAAATDRHVGPLAGPWLPGP